MVKKVKNSSPNTKFVFSSVILCKDKKDISKNVGETNQWLKNDCKQKNIDFVGNSNIKEEHLGSKSLLLNKRGNSILAKNTLRFLRDPYWNNDILNCEMKYDECKSKLPSKSVNSISVGSIRDVRKRNLKLIIVGHLNINSIRNKFNLLVDQIKGILVILWSYLKENQVSPSIIASSNSRICFTLSFRSQSVLWWH